MSSEPRMQLGRPWEVLESPPRGSEEELTSEQGRFQPWINEVRAIVKNLHPRLHPSNQPTICKAPKNMRETDRDAYEPSVVSIGPLHRRLDELENCKWRILRCLLSRCEHRNNNVSRIFDECLMDLRARDRKVRRCYSENLQDFGPCQLATVMFLDGCFIIYLMLRRQEKEEIQSFAYRLETLEGSPEQGTPNLAGESIVEIVDTTQRNRTKDKEKEEGMAMGVLELDLESGSESVVDLEIGQEEYFDGLSLGHLWNWNLIVYDLLKIGNQIPFFVIRLIFSKLFDRPLGYDTELADLALNLFCEIHPNHSRRLGGSMHPYKIHHLLHLFHSSIVTPWRTSQTSAEAAVHGANTTREWIPNATDLAMAGVKFKPKEKFGSFLDVSFENGILQIPPLRIFDYSKSLFRNLIAYEQCYPDENTDITTYANFMDCIIDAGNDARLLHIKGILFNGLSTDDEVASLFNRLCNQIHFDQRESYLHELFIEVNKYHGSKWHQWRAGLVRDYFNSPWTIISVFAAVLLLLLTIEQCFFAAFSYFRPP